MKVWPIDPLVPRNLRLEVPEKLSSSAVVTFRPAVRGGPNPPGRRRQYGGLGATRPVPSALMGFTDHTMVAIPGAPGG